MLLADVRRLTREAAYKINVSWRSIERTLAEYEDSTGLELDPDFQRAHVWDEPRQIAFVEYVLRGGKSSRELQFNCFGWMSSFEGPVVLVDGKQRLESVRKFLRNELPIFGGHRANDFSDLKGHSIRADFVFHVNDLPTRADVLRWYLELNEGGIAHTSDELDRVKELLRKEATS